MCCVKRQETRAKEKDRLEHVVRGNRQDKEARCKGRRRASHTQNTYDFPSFVLKLNFFLYSRCPSWGRWGPTPWRKCPGSNIIGVCFIYLLFFLLETAEIRKSLNFKFLGHQPQDEVLSLDSWGCWGCWDRWGR